MFLITHTHTNPAIHCLGQTDFKFGDTDRLKLKGWRKIHHANTNQKKTRVTVLIAAIRARNILINCKRALHNDKRSILQEDIPIL